MAALDGVVGIKSITTDNETDMPTRGTLHVTGPRVSARDDPDNFETVVNLASAEGTPALSVTTDELTEDVVTLDLEDQDAANVVRVVLGESVAVHGMAAPTSEGNPRKTLMVTQASAVRLEIKHRSTESPAGTRFVCPGTFPYFLLPDSSIDLLYNAIADEWMVVP